MISYILFIWILKNMGAPTWTFVLIGIGVFLKILVAGIKLGKANSDE